MIEAFVYAGIAVGALDHLGWRAFMWPVEVGRLIGRAALRAHEQGEG